MIAHKKEFFGGLILFIIFWVIFAIGMSPIFGDGKNILNYMDNLYNTISKKSAYYIPAVRDKVSSTHGQTVDFMISANNNEQAVRISRQFEAGQAKVLVDDYKITVSGDFGLILDDIIDDADAMFSNDGAAITSKYGYSEKQVLFDLWSAMNAAEKDLTKQKRFKEAKVFNQVLTKAIEPAYNYYGIQAENIGEKVGIVIASLAGYVTYTLWFGFSILFMFEGWGLKLEH